MLSLMVLFAAINFFIVAPLLFIGLSYLFSDDVFSYKKSLILCLQLALIALLVQALQLIIFAYLHSFSTIINLILSLTLLVIATYLIKAKFDTTILNAVVIQIIKQNGNWSAQKDIYLENRMHYLFEFESA